MLVYMRGCSICSLLDFLSEHSREKSVVIFLLECPVLLGFFPVKEKEYSGVSSLEVMYCRMEHLSELKFLRLKILTLLISR